jgi:uncharacterized repeat protein (TIGR04138 family)
MRCNRCDRNDATIFLTQIVDGNTTKVSLCATCGAPFVKEVTSSPQFIEHLREAGLPVPSLADAFAKVAANDPRYPKEAFWFVRDGVDRAVKVHSPPSRHVTAKELLEALRSLALERYGLAAREQLRSWGVTRCEDFGEIVFTLIEHRVFARRPEDKKEDFSDGYDFKSAFPVATP